MASGQCTSICIPAIMDKYVQVNARHTCKGATGMRGTQGMQGSEVRGASVIRMTSIFAQQRWECLAFKRYPRAFLDHTVALCCLISNRWFHFRTVFLEGDTWTIFFSSALGWHIVQSTFIFILVICIANAIVYKMMLYRKRKTRKS